MAVSKTFNGTTYSIPNTRGESGWETTLSTYLQALADSAGTNVAWKQAVRKATTSPVTVNATTDCTIIVDLAVAGASTVNLPAGADKQIFVIVDGKGDASTNNITIDANGSETIEGSLTKVIRLNRECLVLQYSSSAGDWKVIGGYVPNMVGGPASSTDNAIVRFDGTTGKLVQNSGVEVDDSGNIKMSYSSGALGRINYQAASGDKVFLLQTITSVNNYGIGVDSSNLVTLGSVSGADTWNVKAIQYASSGAVSFPTSTTHIFGANSAGNTVVSARTATGDHAVFETRRNNAITTAFGIDDSGSYTNATVGSSAFLGTNGETLHFVTGAGFAGSAGNITTGGAWTLGHATSTTGRHEIQNNANGNQTLRVTNAGNSTPNGIYIFYSATAPNSTSSDFLYCGDTSTGRAIIRSNGGLANYSANNVNLSDVRTKEGIVPAGSYYEKVKSLEIVRFHYKDQNSKTDEDLNLGVVAQQVLEVMPEVVDEGGFNSKDETKLLAIYDTDLMFASIKALQEAMTKIESLQARIEALENP